MKRFRLLLVVMIALSAARNSRAADTAPADLLKDKGLTKSASLYVLPGEAEVLSAMRNLRVNKKKLDDEMKSRQVIEQQIKHAKEMMTKWEIERARLNGNLARVSDPGTQNQYIGKINELTGYLRQGSQEKKDLEEKAARAGADSKASFIDAVMSLAPKSEEVSKKYQELAADAEVKAAIETINQTARPKVKLGPTAEFPSAATLLKRWRGEVESESIPVQVESGVPTLEVTLNGKTTRRMVLDSGASLVCLPGSLAEELNMTPGPGDQKILMQIADGKTIEGRLMTLKSVRVGRFTVEDVECVVLPRDLTSAPALLGDSFLSHFVVKLDNSAGQLHLAEVTGASKSVSVSTGKEPKPAPDKSGGKK